MSPPPPPPPSPICLPFFGGKNNRCRPTYSERSATADHSSHHSSTDAARGVTPTHSALKRSNTVSTPKDTSTKKWGYGWGIGKKMKKEDNGSKKPHIQSLGSIALSDIRSPSRSYSQTDWEQGRDTPRRDRSVSTNGGSIHSIISIPPPSTPKRSDAYKSNTKASSSSDRPTLNPSKSSSNLAESVLEIRDEDPIPDRPDTTSRLESLRDLMRSHSLDYYVIPSEGPHGSEYIAPHDKRREWISGFTGSIGQAIVSMRSAFLITDPRHWRQAGEQLDQNWVVVEVGGPSTNFKDWTEWMIDRANESKIGIDARLISYQTATALNDALKLKNSKLHHPPQNLIDLVWRDKPARIREPIYVQPREFTGAGAGEKLTQLRHWISEQRSAMPSYSKAGPKPSQMQVATLVADPSSIAWLLNLLGDDIRFNPVFYSYLVVGLESATLFIEEVKLMEEIKCYLQSIGVVWREYSEFWTFLGRKEWGDGNVIISPQTSYAICLMMTSFQYTVLPSYIDDMKAIKNDIEIHGLRNAHLRDGAAYVRWLAWMEQKIQQGYDITEYDATQRLTEYRRKNKYYMGLAYETISATGHNAALPHYVPHKTTAKIIDRDTPYLNDSGGQYRDGTCDTTRTIHFGRPTQDQCEAYTRVLQGHISIDSAIFPEGTSSAKLDILARRVVWQDTLNYVHDTRRGFSSCLKVHKGPQSFLSDTVLVPGHVITNEPSFYIAGKWGMRIASMLAVRRVKMQGEVNGDVWLGFERLTVVPIQTTMVREVMLSKEERQWLKNHNRMCLERLEPFLRQDKRAIKYLRREAERGIGIASAPD